MLADGFGSSSADGLARFGSARPLDRLDKADREILLMRHFKQLSNDGAARALGRSEAAAGMRDLRALRRLLRYRLRRLRSRRSASGGAPG